MNEGSVPKCNYPIVKDLLENSCRAFIPPALLIHPCYLRPMKPTLLLLHGAVGASAQLKPLAEKLSADFDVQLFDFPGHGGKQMPQEDFSIPFFADELSAFINRNETAQHYRFRLQHGWLCSTIS